ncbi:hypothetical protein CPT_Sansa118 [Caulobacter phage Sansa]|uniref:Uncharacterized protein n=1 Tax=Caulobacter phage Sansa TaxID=1675600 RepID=A0A0K1LLY3_9CAUD|nr:hypothetical protein HOR07_gp003 [Caulobacter phage Sansa]YP_009785506.1 hypothetical protein HOR07_gp118 [Caulobacter phage Sansa]AKU43407.1 hypothetical protein CPT_Sansa3 [Caulobacter phage Sansa]AKU43522.1 hypothetical protein CPT_Sansa118 [Caulobacter phage Sansa]
MRSTLTPAEREQRARYKARYDRCMREAKDKTKSEGFRAASLAEAQRIKRAYL